MVWTACTTYMRIMATIALGSKVRPKCRGCGSATQAALAMPEVSTPMKMAQTT